MNYNRISSTISHAGWNNRVHVGTLPLLSKDQLKASRYLKQRKIFELLNFLLGHLLCDSPLDPMTYLDSLLERCLQYRWGLAEPPLLFTKAHIEALYTAFDPGEVGVISHEQYITAMVTLGVCTHTKKPTLDEEGRVTKETFVTEAERCLMAMLDGMVCLPAGKGISDFSTYSREVPPPPPPSPATVQHSLESMPEDAVEESEEADEALEVPGDEDVAEDTGEFAGFDSEFAALMRFYASRGLENEAKEFTAEQENVGVEEVGDEGGFSVEQEFAEEVGTFEEQGDADGKMVPEDGAPPEAVAFEEGMLAEEEALTEGVTLEDGVHPEEGVPPEEGVHLEEVVLPEEGVLTEEGVHPEEGVLPEEGVPPVEELTEEGVTPEGAGNPEDQANVEGGGD